MVSPTDGVLQEILKDTGDTIVSNQAIGTVVAGEAAAADPAPSETAEPVAASAPEPSAVTASAPASPAAKKMIAENNVDAATIAGTGKAGRITKEDVASALSAPAAAPIASSNGRLEERVPMSRLRAKVAERLLHASQSTAMLTTFNEVNMAPVMEIRNRYKQEFEKAHEGVRLGFMSFFVRACTEALKRYPAVNASLDGADIVYHGYQDIGVAVSSPRGLVVPVLRNSDTMSLAHIEKGYTRLW